MQGERLARVARAAGVKVITLYCAPAVTQLHGICSKAQ